MIIKINTEGAAFEGDFKNYELARIFYKLSKQFEEGLKQEKILDINGNTCGTVDYSETEI